MYQEPNPATGQPLYSGFRSIYRAYTVMPNITLKLRNDVAACVVLLPHAVTESRRQQYNEHYMACIIGDGKLVPQITCNRNNVL